jgi:hypothetical protein
MGALVQFAYVARLVLSDPHIAVGTANRNWLQQRLEHDDWQSSDAVRLREMLPASMHWLLNFVPQDAER